MAISCHALPVSGAREPLGVHALRGADRLPSPGIRTVSLILCMIFRGHFFDRFPIYLRPLPSVATCTLHRRARSPRRRGHTLHLPIYSNSCAAVLLSRSGNLTGVCVCVCVWMGHVKRFEPLAPRDPLDVSAAQHLEGRSSLSASSRGDSWAACMPPPPPPPIMARGHLRGGGPSSSRPFFFPPLPPAPFLRVALWPPDSPGGANPG